MLVTADEKMVPKLKELWKICFGDSDEYINNFFENAYAPGRTLVSMCEGEVAGAAYLFPCEIGGRRASYLYAGGVFPHFRRRGIYEEMMHSWADWCREREIIPFLKPADDKLWDYYEKIGFSEFLGGKRLVLDGGGDENCTLTKISADGFCAMRDKNRIKWRHMDYILKENEHCGGDCVRVDSASGSVAMVYAVADGVMYVRGLAGDFEILRACATDLMAKIQCSKISLILDLSADCGEYVRLTAAVGADKIKVGAADLLMD